MIPRFCCLSDVIDENIGEQFVFDAPGLTDFKNREASVVLPVGNEERAETLLTAGASRVLVGEAALSDSKVISRLAAKFGAERVGLCVPVRKLAVDWSFETVSNADFKVVTPSLCEPTWEILRADGIGTGTHVEWWIGEMLARGAQTVLVLADIRDDTDLNLCASLVEKLGERLWIAPLSDSEPPLAEWIEFGQVRQLALPTKLYQRRKEWIPDTDPGPFSEVVMEPL
ncbi:MAG: hypothetical protein IPP03_16585 [Dechloromonas sp.]|jgi:hypothetical protein|nr:hypothetical protein [Candidatus Dechloromonas phosphoritropha]MBP8788455.1 hypothetical protein [Azonexus sp.]MBP9227240.1 hypothetical protein [Azonexus sp.]